MISASFLISFFITFWITTGFIYVGRHDEYCRLYEINLSIKTLMQNILILFAGPINWFTYEITFPKYYSIPKDENHSENNQKE